MLILDEATVAVGSFNAGVVHFIQPSTAKGPLCDGSFVLEDLRSDGSLPIAD